MASIQDDASIPGDEVVLIRATRCDRHWPGTSTLGQDFAGAATRSRLVRQAVDEMRDALLDLEDDLLALQWHNEWTPQQVLRADGITARMRQITMAIVAEDAHERRRQ